MPLKKILLVFIQIFMHIRNQCEKCFKMDNKPNINTSRFFNSPYLKRLRGDALPDSTHPAPDWGDQYQIGEINT